METTTLADFNSTNGTNLTTIVNAISIATTTIFVPQTTQTGFLTRDMLKETTTPLPGAKNYLFENFTNFFTNMLMLGQTILWPIFGLIYGGSLLAFIIGRSILYYKQARRQREFCDKLRKKRLEQRLKEEAEEAERLLREADEKDPEPDDEFEKFRWWKRRLCRAMKHHPRGFCRDVKPEWPYMRGYSVPYRWDFLNDEDEEGVDDDDEQVTTMQVEEGIDMSKPQHQINNKAPAPAELPAVKPMVFKPLSVVGDDPPPSNKALLIPAPPQFKAPEPEPDEIYEDADTDAERDIPSPTPTAPAIQPKRPAVVAVAAAPPPPAPRAPVPAAVQDNDNADDDDDDDALFMMDLGVTSKVETMPAPPPRSASATRPPPLPATPSPPPPPVDDSDEEEAPPPQIEQEEEDQEVESSNISHKRQDNDNDEDVDADEPPPSTATRRARKQKPLDIDDDDEN